MRRKGKNKNQSLFRRIVGWLHLWLGLVSGVVVFIVSITGCLYVFHQEITDLTEPWRFVQKQDKPFVPPSKLLEAALQIYPNKTPSGLTYAPGDEAAAVGLDQFNPDGHFSVVFLNPYDASVVKAFTPKDNFKFFSFIEDGHRSLWLPDNIGRPIVGVSILIFVISLITGIIMWWPKKWKKKQLKQSFKIKWNARFFRLNYDLHNVVGFYACIFALILALTGLFYSFKWVENGIYYITSGGESKTALSDPHSQPAKADAYTYNPENQLDKAWYKVMAKIKIIKGGMYINPNLSNKKAPIEIMVYNKPGSFYDQDKYFFDQYSLKPLRVKGDRYAESNFADQLSMLNYDIHVGSFWGLPGKIILFLLSLICASLPVTGFIYWWHTR